MLLEDYYLGEVATNIESIEATLQTIRQNGEFDKDINKILNSIMHIMDMGMIHGFEGVEAVAEQIYAAARYISWQGEESLEDIKPKFLESLETLKKVVDITDPYAARELVDRAKFEMDYQIDDVISVSQEAGFDEQFYEPVRDKTKTIRIYGNDFSEENEAVTTPENENDDENDETDYISTYLKDSFDKAIEWSEAPGVGEFAEPEIENDYIKAFEDGEVVLINEALDEKKNRAIENKLNNLQSVLADLKENLPLIENWQKVADVCGDLKNEIEQLAFEPLADIISPLAEIIQMASENEDAREQAFAILHHCQALIRQFIDDKKVETIKIVDLKSKIHFFEKDFMPEEWSDQLDPRILASLDGIDDMELPPPPKIPLLARLKRFFGMY
ncbi:MAG: hypothetical protein ACE5I1_19125 [bacterium]